MIGNVEFLVEWGNAIWAWFGVEDNQNRAQAIAAVAAVLLTVLGSVVTVVWLGIRALLPKKKLGPTADENEIKVAGSPSKLTLEEFVSLRKELKAELLQELPTASEAGQTQLRARIAELENQLANPDEALAEAQERIKDLETRIERFGNQLGADKIEEARAALEKGDYSVADETFADIEARAEIEVQNAASAAFGRGEVAEAEIRWHDAALHYARSASLNPTLGSLFKAAHFAILTGDFKRGESWAEQMVTQARVENNQPELSRALDRQADALLSQGKHQAAEPLFVEALEIDAKEYGKDSDRYAASLNNLAVVTKKQDRFKEAEKLYLEALEIDRVTVGEKHPEYATHLNNLALVVKAQGRYDEAQNLYRQAIKITGDAVGKDHPSYAIRLLNLGALLCDHGNKPEARDMIEQALKIFQRALPDDHPHIATAQSYLDAL